jgi:hypothetical protein
MYFSTKDKIEIVEIAITCIVMFVYGTGKVVQIGKAVS